MTVLTVTVTGLSEAQAGLMAVLDRISPAVIGVEQDLIQRVFNESQEEVPYDTGVLSMSALLFAADDDGTGVIEAGVSYNTDYAVRQHEDLEYDHPNGRKAKYLEDPFNEQITGLEAAMGAAIGAVL